ncbi:MAG: DUF4974 domain-containing protein [Paludibacteraceae bacterium]|nr:DUF4974 domain-containing protein [Paludibacteraceae bacterium]MBQ8713964.1 DUF4974 domain-containing protein [Prevotella sp.]
MESNDKLEELLRQMYAEEPQVDIDKEWQKFEAKHFAPKRKSWGWMQIAAMFIGVLMLSGIAYAAIHIINNSHSQKTEVQDTTAIAHKASAPAVRQTSQESPTLSEPKTFENVPLKDIVAELTSAYHITIKIRNAEAAALRLYYPWNPQMPLQQVVEELNRFEKVHLTLNGDTLIIE